jgi:hypothetical protein
MEAGYNWLRIVFKWRSSVFAVLNHQVQRVRRQAFVVQVARIVRY